jgi:hypothetical protein
MARLLLLCGLTALSAPVLAAMPAESADSILITARPDPVFPLSGDKFDLASRTADRTQVDFVRLAQNDTPSTPPDIAGPVRPRESEARDGDNRQYRSFGSQVWSVKWEYAAVFAEITAIHMGPFLRDGTHFKWENEGWLGKDTANLGVDKFTHAFNTYLATELLQWRISQKTNNAPGTALTAGLLAMSLVTYSEMYDGFEPHGGFSWQDMTFNFGGAALSILRHSVPGLKDKLDYRMEVIPNHDVVTFTGKEHFRQQRFLLALQLAGFEGLENSPLRFVELHAGYYAVGFTNRERLAGTQRPDRRPFVGIGLNLQQLLFPNPRTLGQRIGHRFLDYAQVPYTAVHVH